MTQIENRRTLIQIDEGTCPLELRPLNIRNIVAAIADNVEQLFVTNYGRAPDFRFVDDHLRLSSLLLKEKLTMSGLCKAASQQDQRSDAYSLINETTVGLELRKRTLERAHPLPAGGANAFHSLIHSEPQNAEAAAQEVIATKLGLEDLRVLSRSFCLMNEAFYQWKRSDEHREGGNAFHFTLGDDTFGPIENLPCGVFDLNEIEAHLNDLFSMRFKSVRDFIAEVLCYKNEE